ncbi:type II toxin-antitoxin system HigB family toxin [Aquiflexum sp. LQ15W]|uniref:Type II toxin-antitoxin system HigB family toxin n=1 Tax=Aquiflexum gelatinilyticum TaxID=2961943 RepID=A0A9X2SZU2_9BACT|nr:MULTISPECIES: type II toxin-antitoxin system HigB family toxin [Cyclobacteriaceae]MCH6199071.1 type II toxin-antitoxin system HigB family toxin [Cognataquiflexum nitidum]MCR9014226.1 type II toxin-antitoxin system HigB family toxin [Aquiflexum gelatinilyticum]
MRIITFKRIKEFSETHADADIPLRLWYSVSSKREWKSLLDIKKDFNSVDYVGNQRFVFNIKGNTYRLIAIISFNAQKIYIRFIGTHAQYDKIKDIQNI